MKPFVLFKVNKELAFYGIYAVSLIKSARPANLTMQNRVSEHCLLTENAMCCILSTFKGISMCRTMNHVCREASMSECTFILHTLSSDMLTLHLHLFAGLHSARELNDENLGAGIREMIPWL